MGNRSCEKKANQKDVDYKYSLQEWEEWGKTVYSH
jgi:hypothetical protein